MGKVTVDESLCKGCELCIQSCPAGCLASRGRLNSKGYAVVEFLDGENKCSGCTFCALMCPDLALVVYK